jgi:carbon monoxide dehydrogenase subunit G
VIRVDTSATIDRPVEDVARYVADIERMTEWTDMTASRRLTDGSIKDGTKAYAEVAVGPVRLGWTYEIQDLDANGGFAFKTITRNALGMDGSIRLAPSGPTSTKVDYHVEIQTRGLLRVLEPLLRGEMAGNEAREVDRLKARLEGGPVAASTPA